MDSPWLISKLSVLKPDLRENVFSFISFCTPNLEAKGKEWKSESGQKADDEWHLKLRKVLIHVLKETPTRHVIRQDCTNKHVVTLKIPSNSGASDVDKGTLPRLDVWN